jgi:hypothetical protein
MGFSKKLVKKRRFFLIKLKARLKMVLRKCTTNIFISTLENAEMGDCGDQAA